jgi:N,N'-diacetylchitobiose transport system permease protein
VVTTVTTAQSRATPAKAGSAAGAVRGRRPRRGRGRRAALNTAATLFVMVWLFPVYWMVNTAFKPYRDILQPTPGFLPVPFSLGEFADALERPMFGDYLRNSLIMTGTAVVLGAALALLAAVAVTRFRFRGRRLFLILVLVVQMIPQPALVIPIFLSLKSADLLNTLPGLAITYVGFVLPFSIWALRGFLHGIPIELEEAAFVDGAGRWGVIRRITLPLVAPGIIAGSVLSFVTAWNEYLFAYVEMKDQDHYTLPVWLVSFSTSAGTDYGGLIAASTLFAVPVVLFFLLIQRRLVEGMTSGAVKD